MVVSSMFTYVTPNNKLHSVTTTECSKLPIKPRVINSVEELFPLLSDPNYHTDFVVINSNMFYQCEDTLDMFDIVNTLNTLIKSTVCRTENGTKPIKRSTKIIVTVDDKTDINLVKQVMQFPAVTSIGWILSKPEDVQTGIDYINQLLAGNYSHCPRVLAMIKTKKKLAKIKKDTIALTSRQAQVLQLVQERGASNKTIARILGLSESTVKLHMGAVLKKFGAKNRTQLVVFTKATP